MFNTELPAQKPQLDQTLSIFKVRGDDRHAQITRLVRNPFEMEKKVGTQPALLI